MSQIQTMSDVLSELQKRYLKNHPYHEQIKSFKRFLSENPFHDVSEVEWLQICDLSSKGVVGFKKMCVIFLSILLENGLYDGSYKEALYRNQAFIKSISKSCILLNEFFCGPDLEYLYLVKLKNRNSIRSLFLKYQNPVLIKMVCEACSLMYLEVEGKEAKAVTDNFETSLGEKACEIKSYADFDEYTFWQQICFFKKKYHNLKGRGIPTLVHHVVSFYQMIAKEHPENDFLSKATTLSWKLLFSNSLTMAICDDAYFMTYNTATEIHGKYKLMMLLKNFNKISTTFEDDDYRFIDLTPVHSDFYKEEILQYLLYSPGFHFLWTSQVSQLIETFVFFEHLKTQKDYPNPNLKKFTTEEAIMIRNRCFDPQKSLATNNNSIGTIHRFFQWEVECRSEMIFDFDFFNYLGQYEERSKTSGKSIPDQDLAALNKVLVEHAKTSIKGKVCYGIFHIALQTEFRTNQICHLTIDCIKPTIKPNFFAIYSNSKTSHGRVEKSIITEYTQRLLMDIIDATDSLRNANVQEDNSKYIFIYPAHKGSATVMNADIFRTYLMQCCKEAGIPNYSPINLRDTHMTKSFEHILRNGKSDTEMKILSKHRYLDTTKNHYIEMNLEKMLEATYGIIIGDKELIDPKDNIVEALPKEIDKKSSVVENGCGNCKCKSCVIKTSLPCLACKYFVTTVEHEKFFVKAIKNVDKLIEKAKTRHDIEDLTIVKTLYVLYLEAIYRKKADSNGND